MRVLCGTRWPLSRTQVSLSRHHLASPVPLAGLRRRVGVPLTLWCCFAVRMGPIGSIDENGNIGPLALIEGVHNNGMVCAVAV